MCDEYVLTCTGESHRNDSHHTVLRAKRLSTTVKGKSSSSEKISVHVRIRVGQRKRYTHSTFGNTLLFQLCTVNINFKPLVKGNIIYLRKWVQYNTVAIETYNTQVRIGSKQCFTEYLIVLSSASASLTMRNPPALQSVYRVSDPGVVLTKVGHARTLMKRQKWIRLFNPASARLPLPVHQSRHEARENNYAWENKW